MKDFIRGFLLGTIGITAINTVCEIIAASGEFVKAVIGSKVVDYNSKIEEAISKSESVRVIGFQTTDIEEDGEYVED